LTLICHSPIFYQVINHHFSSQDNPAVQGFDKVMTYQKRKLDRQPLFSKPQIERTRQIIIIPELCKGTSCKICITFCQNEVLELSTDEFNSLFLKPIHQNEPRESQSEES